MKQTNIASEGVGDLPSESSAQSTIRKSILSWSLLFACNLMWALQFTCIKLVQDQEGVYFTVWAPMLLSTLMLLPFVIKDLTKEKEKFWKDFRTFGLLALIVV